LLNQDILKLTIKVPGQIPKPFQSEITHYDEMNDKIFHIDIDIDGDVDVDIDMKVWDNARNVIESISFHRFHGPSNWPAYALSGCLSFIHSYELLPC
jgi:hypothetical protein